MKYSPLIAVLLLTTIVHGGISSSRSEEVEKNDQEIADYLAKFPQNYNWNSHFATGKNGVMGIPYILFRLLPELDSKLWGEAKDNFAKFGFWNDERMQLNGERRPLPMGFGWTGANDLSARKEFGSSDAKLSMVTRTCSSCHTQRVRLDDGHIKYIEGAPNTEIQLHTFKAAKIKFFTENLNPKNPEKVAEFKSKILKLIEEKQKLDPNWFFRKWYGYTTEVEAQEIEVFKSKMDEVFAQIFRNAMGGFIIENRLKKFNYSSKDPEHPSLDYHEPMPGLMDTNGSGQAGFSVALGLKEDDPTVRFFFGGSGSKSDIPPIWRQSDLVVNHWSGFLKDNFFRNVTAALGIVGAPENIDPVISYSQTQFVSHLPSPKYPFEIDREKARRGEKHFAVNCMGCHQPHRQILSGKFVYPEIKTDQNLLNSNTAFGFKTLLGIMKGKICATDVKIGEDVYPCRIDFQRDFAVFRTNNPDAEDVKMVFKENASKLEKAGYLARPLSGIWAQSPFLHNGSIPTLRHLLMPGLRKNVNKFVRGSISFDKENVGFEWDVNQFDKLKKSDPGIGIFDTKFDGLSNQGHDFEQIEIPDRPGNFYRLNWDDDPVAADEIIEYLKTL